MSHFLDILLHPHRHHRNSHSPYIFFLSPRALFLVSESVDFLLQLSLALLDIFSGGVVLGLEATQSRAHDWCLLELLLGESSVFEAHDSVALFLLEEEHHLSLPFFLLESVDQANQLFEVVYEVDFVDLFSEVESEVLGELLLAEGQFQAFHD